MSKEGQRMFPTTLDGAKVLCYTDQGDYGPVHYTTGEVYDRQAYFAICQYPGSSDYYLFGCNESFNVISDFPCDSIAQCRQNAEARHTGILWHAAATAHK